jgi:tetratricopeptide (TPR) repeat protein
MRTPQQIRGGISTDAYPAASAAMDTLYDLLGALPRDDAEDLRVAFRRAVKGTHPDLRPGDPDAALKFRQIVRANEILADPEQRAAYDHLVKVAREEQQSITAHPIAARIHRLATGVIALTVFSIASVAGYLLFMHLATTLVAHANDVDGATRLSASIAAVRAADPPGQLDEGALIAKHQRSVRGEVILASAAMPLIDVESIPAPDGGAVRDAAPNDAWSFRARGISAYRNGDLNGALTDLDQAIQLDPKSSASYIDRGIVFFHLQKFDRAFADIAQAQRIEKKGASKSMPAIARKPGLEKPRFDQTAMASSAAPKGPRRPTAQGSSPAKGLASVVLRRREVRADHFCDTLSCLHPN